jgi:hypothetical protein
MHVKLIRATLLSIILALMQIRLYRLPEIFGGPYKVVENAETFEEYIKHAKPLYYNPVQRKLGFVSALWDETNWKPHSPEEESFYDPVQGREV